MKVFHLQLENQKEPIRIAAKNKASAQMKAKQIRAEKQTNVVSFVEVFEAKKTEAKVTKITAGYIKDVVKIFKIKKPYK